MLKGVLMPTHVTGGFMRKFTLRSERPCKLCEQYYTVVKDNVTEGRQDKPGVLVGDLSIATGNDCVLIVLSRYCPPCQRAIFQHVLGGESFATAHEIVKQDWYRGQHRGWDDSVDPAMLLFGARTV